MVQENEQNLNHFINQSPPTYRYPKDGDYDDAKLYTVHNNYQTKNEERQSRLSVDNTV